MVKLFFRRPTPTTRSEQLETVVVNFFGNLRRQQLHGRWHLVADATLIVPGVMHGSKGPLLYPRDEIARNHQAWDGMPLVVWHPKDADGNPVKARDPEVLAEYQIGHVYNSRVKPDGTLVAEAWFDEALTVNFDKRLRAGHKIMPRLLSKTPISLSTGLFTDNHPAPSNSVYNAGDRGFQSYTHVARNYRPDHLAVLPDQPGACDVKDGCGINVNAKRSRRQPSARLKMSSAKACKILHDKQVRGHKLTERQRGMFGAKCGRKSPTTNQGVSDMTKKQKIAVLTANCSCWKNRKAVLNGMKDEEIDELYDREQVVNAVNETLGGSYKEATGADLTVNAMPDFLKTVTVNEDDETEDDDDEDVTDNADEDEDDESLAFDDPPAPTPKKGKKPTGNMMHADCKKLGKKKKGKKMMMEDDEDDKPTGNKGWANVTEWMNDPNSAPAAVKQVVANGLQAQKEAKFELVGKLTANIKNPKAKREAAAVYLKMDLRDLKKIPAPAAGPVGNADDSDDDISQFFNSSWGRQGGPAPTGNRRADANDDEPTTNEPPLEMPTLRYDRNAGRLKKAE